MSYTVGLDFGTHQTKVCIEDASNPAQKIYEFFEFENPFGEPSVLFPSIVQINEDDTISYGFVDDEKCKYRHGEGIAKPTLRIPLKPALTIPTKPNEPVYPKKPVFKAHSLKQRLQSLINKISRKVNPEVLAWVEECDRIRQRHKKALDEWKNICTHRQDDYQIKLTKWELEYNRLVNQYQATLNTWKKEAVEKFNFRYFKLATFTNSVPWSHSINSDIISTWYIAYIILTLQEKFGNNFYLQMGIPSGMNQNILHRQENRAYTILIAAYKLAEKYRTKVNFLNEKYPGLLNSTALNSNYSNRDLDVYGLKVMPEAFAGLSSITQQKRIETGMNLLVDIGGGTTDVAFFTIRKDQPDIHSVISFPKGLNYIFENYIKQYPHLNISEIQHEFFKNEGKDSKFKNSIYSYHEQLQIKATKMLSDIRDSFDARRSTHGLPLSRLTDALKNRPIVFCGGGSLYQNMRIPVSNFSDLRLIDKNLLNIRTIRNRNFDDRLFTILATSYGLSIPLENNIAITPIENVFDHIEAPRKDRWEDDRYDYGLTDD